jgi:uncharacterized protein YndB with AHSA1/START domain
MDEHTATATDRERMEIEVTRIVDAPRDLVFEAWTDAEHLAKWWGPEGFSVAECTSDPRPGGALMIVMRGPDGVDYPMTGTYREVQRPERLVVESTAVGEDGTPLLEAIQTVTFTDLDGKTEITVRSRATALVPIAIAMLGGMEAGLTQSLQCLDDVLTGAVERQIVVGRVFQAPRELVFRAFTEQDQVERWWGPTGFTLTTHEMDVRPGGTWRSVMHGPDGVDYPNTVVYEEIAPPARLVYRHVDPEFRTTVTFDEFMGMTALTMRLVFATAEQRDAANETYHATEGTNQTLDRLGEHLAEIAPPTQEP